MSIRATWRSLDVKNSSFGPLGNCGDTLMRTQFSWIRICAAFAQGLLLIVVGGQVVSESHADEVAWTRGANDNGWNFSPNNWYNSTTGTNAYPTRNDDVTISVHALLIWLGGNLNDNKYMKSLTFSGADPKNIWANGDGSTLGERFINLMSGGITMTEDSGPVSMGNCNTDPGLRNNTQRMRIQIINSQAVTNNSASLLRLGSSEVVAAGYTRIIPTTNSTAQTTHTLKLAGSGTGGMDIYAVIEDATDGRIRAVEIDQPNAVVNLYGANPYTGATTITAGTLALGETGSIGGSQRIFVAEGATFDLSAKSSGMAFMSAQSLGGFGEVVLPTGQTVIAPGSLIPGTDGTAGTLAFTESGTLDISQTLFGGLIFDLGTTSDLMTVASGTLDIGSELIEFDDFTFAAGTGFGQGTYTLFSAGSISGTLGANVSGMVEGLQATLAVDGSSLTLTAVPEPSTLALFGLGVAFLGWVGYQRSGRRERRVR
jgi:autotransporter-associated beta strand protein